MGLPLLPFVVTRVCPLITSFHAITGDTKTSLVVGPSLIALSDCSILTNEEIDDTVSRRLRSWSRKTRLIPIGTNIVPPESPGTEDRNRARREIGVGPDVSVIAHFGLLYPGKGLETLLEALTLLQTPRCRLLVIGDAPEGSDSDYSKHLRRFADDLGVSSSVTWLGHLSTEDVSKHLIASDVYAMPYDEGFSIRRGTFLAGLYHDLPIVTTRPVVPTRYVTSGREIVFVPPRDAGALAGSIDKLMASPEKRRRMVACAGHLKDTFTWPAIAAETVELYRSLSR